MGSVAHPGVAYYITRHTMHVRRWGVGVLCVVPGADQEARDDGGHLEGCAEEGSRPGLRQRTAPELRRGLQHSRN